MYIIKVGRLYDDDFLKRKVKKALLIRQNNFNQDSSLVVSPI